MKKFASFVIGLLGSTAMAQDVKWPPLPVDGFFVGRTAVQADVDSGVAIFATGIEESAGKTLEILIPQYGWYVDENVRVPVLILQAEEANDNKVIGARDLNGGNIVGLAEDFILLGTETPLK
jgi:hypothetical protein